MKIKDLLKLLMHNLIFITLGLILGVGVGNLAVKNQAPMYEAATKIFVNRIRQQSNSDILSLSNEQMLAINLQMAKSQPVINEVSTLLGSQVDLDNIIVEAIPNSLIIQIKVQDTNPKRAAAIANLLVQTLIRQNESLLSNYYSGFETAINAQLQPAQEQINQLQTEINQLKTTGISDQLNQVNLQIAQIKTETTNLEKIIASYSKTLTPIDVITLAEKQAQLDQRYSLMNLYQQIQTNLTYIGKPAQNESGLENPRLANLRATLDIYQQMNSSLINDLENVRLARAQSKQNVTQIVAAIAPNKPVRPIPILYILMGGIVGLALTLTTILLIDHLDESLKSVNQVESLLDLPVMGIVDEIKFSRNELITISDHASIEAQGYCALGADLEINGVGKNIHTLMVINAEPSAARTHIAANLAVSYAQQGKTVVLLDGDLKRPVLHKLFGLENRMGFAELLAESTDTLSVCHKIEAVNGLSVMPGGKLENDAIGWLDPQKLSRILLSLENFADVIVVNSPPAGAADAQVLASKMDAVLLAIQGGHTRLDSVNSTLRRFQIIGARKSGIIFYRTIPFRKIRLWSKTSRVLAPKNVPGIFKSMTLASITRFLSSVIFPNMLKHTRKRHERTK